jgi:threonine synthase
LGGEIRHFIKCIECGMEYEPSPIYRCGRCNGLLEIRIKLPDRNILLSWKSRAFNVWRYRELLPVDDYNMVVSMDEGGTRLLNLDRVGESIGKSGFRLFLKVEGDNPTGSFKDRGMTVGVTKAREFKYTRVACASTGNTSASMAAYAARAGLEPIVFIPRGKIARGKLSQAIAYGATIVEVEGVFDDALRKVFDYVAKNKVYLLNSINPYRLEGQKTIAYEIYEQLGKVPDYIVVPVGNAGNISAIWKGFKELFEIGVINCLPIMVGVQAEGASPLAKAYMEKRSFKPLEDPRTLASAIRIGNPVNWPKAWRAVEESNGFFLTVSDEEIVSAQMKLAREEGILVEPASASPLAALLKNQDAFEGNIVLIATGHGLKDPDILMKWPYKTGSI